MSRKNTINGHYDIELGEEIKRMIDGMKGMGISNPTILEATWLIAERNRRVNMTDKEIRSLIAKSRGISL